MSSYIIFVIIDRGRHNSSFSGDKQAKLRICGKFNRSPVDRCNKEIGKPKQNDEMPPF